MIRPTAHHLAAVSLLTLAVAFAAGWNAASASGSVALATSKPATPQPAAHPAPPGHGYPTTGHGTPRPSGSSGYHPTTFHPSSTNYHSTPANSHSTPTKYHPSSTNYHSTPAISHPATSHSVQGIAHGRIADPHFYSGVSAYHRAHYTASLNKTYALHPHDYHGHYAGGWYHGYWHEYWAAQPWLWFNGYYGFWLDIPPTVVFVAEMAPGVCVYWNGYAWVPYWDPPYTPYYCPY